MGTILLNQIARFVLLVFFQILILNQINFSGYITPYAYVLFILLLPFDVPKTALLISAFVLGLSIDMFMDSLGMHAAACVFMAFFRPSVINLISIKTDFEEGSIPTIKNNGLRWMAAYTLILVFIHHGFLFFVEVFSFAEFWQTIGRTFLSSATTFIIIIIFYYLFGKFSKK